MNGTEFARISGTYNTAYIGTYELIGQDSTGLKSIIKLRGYFYYGGGTQVINNGSFAFILDGTTINSGTYYSYTPGYHKLGEKTIEVTHNADGSFPGRSVSISTSGNYMHVQGSASGTITGIPSISVEPLVEKIVSSNIIYFKENGTWLKKVAFIKVDGVWQNTKEYFKTNATWKYK